MFPYLVRCDQERIVFATPRGVRLAGLALVGLGLALLVLAVVFAATVRDALHVAIIIAVALLFTGCLTSLWVDELHLDCVRQWYRRRFGLLPFARSRSGTYSDFDHLVMKRYEWQSRGKKSESWLLFLVWKDPSRRDVRLVLRRLLKG